MSVRAHLDAVIRRAGSIRRLGTLCGLSDTAIRAARRAGRCSPGLALRVERVTGVPRAGLCPASFGGEPAGPASLLRGRRAEAEVRS